MTDFNDYPIEDCAAKANLVILKGWAVLQKFTCKNCGSRQTMGEPNVFYRSGTCQECGHISVITQCNFMATTLSVDNVRQFMKG